MDIATCEQVRGRTPAFGSVGHLPKCCLAMPGANKVVAPLSACGSSAILPVRRGTYPDARGTSARYELPVSPSRRSPCLHTIYASPTRFLDVTKMKSWQGSLDCLAHKGIRPMTLSIFLKMTNGSKPVQCDHLGQHLVTGHTSAIRFLKMCTQNRSFNWIV